MLNGSAFFQPVNTGKVTIFEASIYNINMTVNSKDLKEQPMEKILPKQYPESFRLLSKVMTHRLATHHPGILHEIQSTDGKLPSWGPLHSMSNAELIVLKE